MLVSFTVSVPPGMEIVNARSVPGFGSGSTSSAFPAASTVITFEKNTIAIQEIIKEYQRQKTNQRSRKGGSARKPQQYHAEAEVII